MMARADSARGISRLVENTTLDAFCPVIFLVVVIMGNPTIAALGYTKKGLLRECNTTRAFHQRLEK